MSTKPRVVGGSGSSNNSGKSDKAAPDSAARRRLQAPTATNSSSSSSGAPASSPSKKTSSAPVNSPADDAEDDDAEAEEEEVQEERPAARNRISKQDVMAQMVQTLQQQQQLLAEQRQQMQEMQQQIGALTMAQRAPMEAASSASSSHGARDGENDEREVASSFTKNGSGIARKQLPVAQPVQLTYTKASEHLALEAWIRSMELMFKQSGEEREDVKLAELGNWVDSDVDLWWTHLQEAETAAGAPVETWARFKELLRANFQPRRAVLTALEEFMNTKMAAGEKMDRYVMRMAQLHARTHNSLGEVASMHWMRVGVRREDYPMTMQAVDREVTTNRVTTMAQLRTLLQHEALAEPKQRQSASSSAHSQPKTATSHYKKHKDRSVRAAAAALLQEALDQTEDGTDEGGQDDREEAPGGAQSIAAVQRSKGRGFGRERGCARCGKADHFTRDCKQPDTRTCFNCQEMGHISTDCKNPKKKRIVAISTIPPAPAPCAHPGEGIVFMVARMGKRVQGKQLVILRGFVRQAGGWEMLMVRAMFDTGAEGDFLSPSFAKKLGARIETGNFGTAVTAFGEETTIRGRVSDLELVFRGMHPASGLGQDFRARHKLLVAPGELSTDYELLLGGPFLDKFRAQLQYGEQPRIQLTAEDGTTTSFTSLEGSGEEENKIAAAAVIEQPQRATQKPLAGNARRKRDRAWKAVIDDQEERAKRAAVEMPELVMSSQELETLMAEAEAGTVRITPILFNGFEEESPARMLINTITARGAEAAKKTESAPEEPAASELGLLPEHERADAGRRCEELVKEFPDVFTSELPHINELKSDPADKGVDILLKEGAHPSGRYGPRMTAEDTEKAGKMLQELLAKGFIRPSRSPWGAPMFLVDKPDGGKRMVIDYRSLNAATVRNRYPLPRVDELFDQLQGAQYFSKIDLRTGYWQIRMAADAVEKTAFTSRHGHYEWLVLPMGLTNAPAEFMAMMEQTFQAELNKFILVFLDDILIYSKTLREHEEHLRAAMGRLRAKGLHAKLSKCSFFRQEVEFLGHYVGRAGVRMVEGKVEAVRAWPTPTKQKDVEQFIGLAGYYRRFIADFSKIASPLTELCGTLKKEPKGKAARGEAWKKKPPQKEFKWGAEQQRAFELLKEAVSRAPCLAMPDPKRDFIVHTDASGYATGAVLMQQFEEGLRPIAFLSKKMKPAERNYPVYEQELLAILNALRAWRHYLGGRHFTVCTDHQSLQYVEVSAMATPRQVRWATWLSEFDFSIKYTPGTTNVVADALSRAAAGSAPERKEDTGGRRLLINAIAEMAPIPVRIRRAAVADGNYAEMLGRDDTFLEARGMSKVRGLLYRKNSEGEHLLVVPENKELRTWMLSWAHDALEAGHRGGPRMHEWLKARVWWPKMGEDAQRYANGCESCQRSKPDQKGRQGLPLSIETPKRAMECITMDFIGPLRRSALNGCTHVMVVVDKLTRYVMYIPLGDNASAQEVFNKLDQRWISLFGIPRAIISDRDSRFTSHFWENLWTGFGTELKRSTAFHPQTDGTTERANRTLIEMLRNFVDSQGDDWEIMLPQLQRAANAAVSASTGYSPDFMVFGQEMQSGMDADLEAAGVEPRNVYPGAQQILQRRTAAEATARREIEKAQAKQRADSAKGRRAPDIKQGDRVWLSTRNLRNLGEQQGARKLEPRFYGPYEVLEMHGTNAAKLKLPQGCLLHPVFNLDKLKKYVDGQQEFPNRPARYNQPGPMPEEDPAAGGPLAGEPVYEVEKVIARRGRGVRMEYRVLWKGWPPETASWIGSDNWAGIREAIDAFEKRPAGPQARVAAVGRRARVRARKAETEATRQAAVKATLENVPRAADRPPVDKDGQIDMGAQRCTADTKAGCWCKARTRHGCLCWVHRSLKDGTQIKKSAVPGAGDGLFAKRDFKKNEIIARYTGDLINTGNGEHRMDGFGGSHYVLELSQQIAIDAARTNTADGRMINDARGTGKRMNVRFVPNQRAKTVTIRTTRAVKAGEEFLLSYGRGFWGAVRGVMRAEPEAAAAAPRAQQGTVNDPIVVARFRLNMLGMQPPPETRWIGSETWECICPDVDDARYRQSHRHWKLYCETCHRDRPDSQGRPEPQQPGGAAAAAQGAQEYQAMEGSYSGMAGHFNSGLVARNAAGPEQGTEEGARNYGEIPRTGRTRDELMALLIGSPEQGAPAAAAAAASMRWITT